MRIKTFKQYAGSIIKGKIAMPMDIDYNDVITHAELAAWLTAQVESNGLFGSVMNYDGTGMTAGIHQAVAVYPKHLKQGQGSLWALLDDIQTSLSSNVVLPGHLEFIQLQSAFVHDGFTFHLDGVLYDDTTNKPATARQIRQLLTGDKAGRMPKKGRGHRRSVKYLTLFHNLFSEHSTFNAQYNFGIKHFLKLAKVKLKWSALYPNSTLNDLIYAGSNLVTVEERLSPALNLAMCMFWSHSVNAPYAALKLFCAAADRKSSFGLRDPDGDKFAKTLIRKLGTSKYGRWDDNIKNGRYQRTRRYALRASREHGCPWHKYLFIGPDAIMPSEF